MSVSVTTSATERYMPKNRREGCGQVITEKDARVKRVTDGTHQQLELHELKKKIAEEELLMIKERREQQRQIAIVERKQKEEMLLEQRQHQKQMFQMEYRRAELSVQAAADEAELASLKLQQFKKNVNIINIYSYYSSYNFWYLFIFSSESALNDFVLQILGGGHK